MVQGDERYARVKHQTLFLQSRGLMSPEMTEGKDQLRVRERFAGKDAGKLDPNVLDRFHDALEKAAMEQLKATGLLDEWLEAWEKGIEPTDISATVPRRKGARPLARPIDEESTVDVDRTATGRSVSDALTELERAVQLFSAHVANFQQLKEHANARS